MHRTLATSLSLIALGTIAAPATAAPYRQLHSFTKPEGKFANSGTVTDAAGNIYGTLALGGPTGAGQIYRLAPGGTLTILYNFHGVPDGRIPDSAPALDADGNLYGTTGYGGTNDKGTVWKLAPPAGGQGAWTETIVHSFGTGTDGATPQDRLTIGAGGVVTGTTVFGGTTNNGTVFALTPAGGGTYTESVLYNFGGGLTDGANPVAGLLADGQGGFYGTTAGGGPGASGGNGTVFHLTPSTGGTYANTTLHFFQGAPADGAGTFSQLVPDQNGTLYGTTFLGGAHNAGTAFSITPSGQETVLANFGGNAGKYPYCGLIFDTAGRLWGTTFSGGESGRGVIFSLEPPGSGTVWTLRNQWSFQGPPDGSRSYATLAPGRGGLIGTTYQGGAGKRGTIFAIQP